MQLKELDGQGGHTEEFHGGGEHPLRAQSWKATDMGSMAKMCGGRFTVHGCCHEMRDSHTKGLVKRNLGVGLAIRRTSGRPWRVSVTMNHINMSQLRVSSLHRLPHILVSQVCCVFDTQRPFSIQ